MKISLFTFFSFLFFTTTLFGQIQITDAYFPVSGDTLYYAFDALPGQVDLSTGADKTWDYTNLQGRTTRSIYAEAATGDSAYLFPTADMVITEGSLGESYFKSSDREHVLLGYIGGAPAAFDQLQVNVRFSPPYVERHAPLNYEDQLNTTSSISLPIAFDELPSFITDSLANFQPDSVRLRIAIDKEHEVDGWGTITTPDGSYEVLREKVTEYRNTRVDVLVTLGPLSSWQDITGPVVKQL